MSRQARKAAFAAKARKRRAIRRVEKAFGSTPGFVGVVTKLSIMPYVAGAKRLHIAGPGALLIKSRGG